MTTELHNNNQMPLSEQEKIESRKDLVTCAYITVLRFSDVGAMNIGKLRKNYPDIHDYLLDMMEIVVEEVGYVLEGLNMYFEFDDLSLNYIKSSAEIKSLLAKYGISPDDLQESMVRD